MIREILADAAHSFKMMASRPGFTLVVVLTLAIGIGATTAMFGTVNAALTDRRRLDAYMLHHAQHRALTERTSVIPIAKVASFDAQ